MATLQVGSFFDISVQEFKFSNNPSKALIDISAGNERFFEPLRMDTSIYANVLPENLRAFAEKLRHAANTIEDIAIRNEEAAGAIPTVSEDVEAVLA